MLDGVEVLYHCAGQLTNEQAMRSLHVDATHKLVSAASGRLRHWVQLSSVGVYGPVRDGVLTEGSALHPVGEYEVSKAESDRIVAEGAGRGGYSYSILRPSNVFGASMSNQSLYGMTAMIERGWFFFIGEPGASANYIHVDNVAEALIRCATMEAARGMTYNLSDHRTLEQFSATIAEALGCAVPGLRVPEALARATAMGLDWLPRFPLTRSRVDALSIRTRYPITRIRQQLGYEHLTSMEDGLKELVGVYRLRQRVSS